MKENNKVLLGMSGGTDSSVAALLLQDAGYEVTGITFRFFEKDGNTEYLDDARDLCCTLGIPHLIYDARKMFQEKIIRYFIQEYMAGRTPVPCTLCNNYLKWPLLQQVADEKGIYHLATGHYVNKQKQMDTGTLPAEMMQIKTSLSSCGDFHNPFWRECASLWAD